MGFELAKAFITVRGDSSRLRGDFAVMRGMTHAHINALNGVIARGVGLFSLYRGAMLAVSGIDLAGEMEQTQIAFETMLGSTREATQLLKELYSFARTTPFRFEGVISGARILMATGTPIKELMSLMRDLGDVSAGSGKNFRELAVIFGQVRSKGRLMGDEIRQFTEANIPILQVLSRTLGKTERQILDLSEKGQVSFKQLETALRSMAKAGGIFSDLTERQSKSVLGLWSNLQDSVQFTMMTIFQALQPLTKGFLEFGLSMTDSIQSSVLEMKDKINDFGLDMLEWLRVIRGNWSTVWDAIKMAAAIQLVKIEDRVQVMAFKVTDAVYGIVGAFKAGFGVAVQYGKDFFTTMGLGFAYLSVSLIRFGIDATMAMPRTFAFLAKSLGSFLWEMGVSIKDLVFLLGRTLANMAEGIVDMFAAVFSSDTISSAFDRTMQKIVADYDKTKRLIDDKSTAPQLSLVDEFKNSLLSSTWGEEVGVELDKMIKKMENTDPMAEARKAMEDAFTNGNGLPVPRGRPVLLDNMQQELNRLVGTLFNAKNELESQRTPPAELNEPRPGPFTGTGGGDQNAFLKGGRFDFAEVGKKLQDALLKTDDDKQDRMIGLLERGNKIQEDQLKAMAKPVKVDVQNANFGLGD